MGERTAIMGVCPTIFMWNHKTFIYNGLKAAYNRLVRKRMMILSFAFFE
ncbi:hypothetical protein STRDD11_02164 [Streptococcus sp. DD11]|nr:hypothetical protein STRDD11_02164 [Streptococcus sp. DD11]